MAYEKQVAALASSIKQEHLAKGLLPRGAEMLALALVLGANYGAGDAYAGATLLEVGDKMRDSIVSVIKRLGGNPPVITGTASWWFMDNLKEIGSFLFGEQAGKDLEYGSRSGCGYVPNAATKSTKRRAARRGHE